MRGRSAKPSGKIIQSAAQMAVRVAVATLALVATGCTEKPVEATVVETPRKGWSEVVEVKCSNSDTLSLKNIGVILRVENVAAERGVRIAVGCTSPAGVQFADTLVVMAEKRNSGGSFTDYGSEWIERARLSEQGEYLFTIAPVEPTFGVAMAGVTIVPCDE